MVAVTRSSMLAIGIRASTGVSEGIIGHSGCHGIPLTTSPILVPYYSPMIVSLTIVVYGIPN